MVRAGETYDVKGVRIRIMEVIPYRTYIGRRELMIGYRIEERGFRSPLAHIWMREGDDIRPHLEEVVTLYKEIRESLTT